MSEKRASRTPALERWIHPPRQARSHLTLDRILNATEQLLEKREFDEITVPQIVREAQSSVGSFYARFKDKRAVLHTIHERYAANAYSALDADTDPASWEGEGIPEIIRAIIDTLVDLMTTRGGLVRAFVNRSRIDIELRDRHESLRRYGAQRWTEIMLARREHIQHPEPRFACEFALRQISSVLRSEILGIGGPHGGQTLPPERVADELHRAVVAYLSI